jgi:hypothetical protein
MILQPVHTIIVPPSGSSLSARRDEAHISSLTRDSAFATHADLPKRVPDVELRHGGREERNEQDEEGGRGGNRGGRELRMLVRGQTEHLKNCTRLKALPEKLCCSLKRAARLERALSPACEWGELGRGAA